MSFMRKGPPSHFPPGLKADVIGPGKIRMTFSAGFVETGCDFSAEQVEKIVSHLHDVLQGEKLTSFNYNPTKDNVNIEDEESRA